MDAKSTAVQVKESVKEALVGTELTTAEATYSATTRLRFEEHATVYSKDDENQRLMSPEDFINAITPSPEDAGTAYHKIPREQYVILFKVADRRKAGLLTLQDYAFFENLLKKPDAEFEIAFRLFDTEGTGSVNYNEFVRIYKENCSSDALPFDWNSNWAALYIGGNRARHAMNYHQFSQMLRGLQGERVRQAFQHYDSDKNGYIDPDDFQRIIEQTSKHKLSDHVLENLHTLCNVGMSTRVSYANVRAFQNIVKDMDLVEVIVRNATAKSKDGLITRADFLNEAARATRWGSFTPMEVDVLFHFASLDNTSGRLSLEDFQKVIDPSWQDPSVSVFQLYAPVSQPDAQKKSKGGMHQVLLSAYNFGLGAVAGAFGATMVYPIDLVKTRMQNQRAAVIGNRLYDNSIDCFRKVIRNEGFKGLYRGLGPQLVGVAPEKAIKLTVNDFVRGWGQGTGEGGKGISLPYEILAGATAGGCQVIFTNPLEIVKIRLQIQGEIAKSSTNVPRRSALWIVQNLGLVGLYKGASACLLRDIPFSAIYFPTYAHLKKDYFGESPEKKLGILQLLVAGAIAGMPAAYLTTPCDVIKTRLQVEARKGETSYRGLGHAAKTIMKEEGFKAFFKGGAARILRSSPQFGFTLAAYELLQTVLPMPGSTAAKAAEEAGLMSSSAVLGGKKVEELPYLRSRNALKLILDLDQNFGKPKLPTAGSEAWSTISSMGASSANGQKA